MPKVKVDGDIANGYSVVRGEPVCIVCASEPCNCERIQVQYNAQQKVDPALKYDGGKLRMDLVPADALRELAEVYTYGAGKYADENWRNGMSWKRIYGAILRHLTSWFLGEDLDKESGKPHLAHAAWGLFTLMHYSKLKKDFDDRPVDSNNGHCTR